ncbi:MAG TPA: hypothetical protein VGH07_05640, partial [Chthoniobacterales bacterium]
MIFARCGALAVAASVALVWICSAKADEVEVQFSGVITSTNAPGLFTGEGFSGGFSYSTTDPFLTSAFGLTDYSLVSPEDGLFVSAGGLDASVAPPANVLTAVVGQGPLSFDPDPAQAYFSIQSFSSGTVSIQLIGNSNFLTSDALPDPLSCRRCC